MTDPLSVTAAAVGFISFGIDVCNGLRSYYESYRGRDETIARMYNSLNGLSTVLETLGSALENRKRSADGKKLVEQLTLVSGECTELMNKLQSRLDKIKASTTAQSKIGQIKAIGHKAIYPLKESTIVKLKELIDETRDSLGFSLDVLHLADIAQTRDEVADVKILVLQLRASKLKKDVRMWLQAPDAVVSYNDAKEKRYGSTGLWFVKGKEFQSWLSDSTSPWVWLSGFAGCGKSVLCSTAIESTLLHKVSHAEVAVCFFYFSFSDAAKQDVMSMLRALVLQLSHQVDDGYADLTAMYNSHGDSSAPTKQELLDLLESLVRRFETVYLLLDALDESPNDDRRQNVLHALRQMNGWSNVDFRLLLTSRDASDIRDCLGDLTLEIGMQNKGIDDDISMYIKNDLRETFSMKKWERYWDRIEQVLTERANGSKHNLERFLTSIPRSLGETYDRMLENIDPDLYEDVFKMLLFLCFSARPLFASEIAHFLAVEPDEPRGKRFNSDKCYQEERDILGICPGFLQITDDYFEYVLQKKVRLAHFSVQEYLVSDQLRCCGKDIAKYYIDKDRAHCDITRSCLGYLLNNISFGEHVDLTMGLRYPLLRYTVTQWAHHCRLSGSKSGLVYDLVIELLQNKSIELLITENWTNGWGYELDSEFEFASETRKKWTDLVYKQQKSRHRDGTTALYSAAQIGLEKIVSLIIETCRSSLASHKNLVSDHDAVALGLSGDMRGDRQAELEPYRRRNYQRFGIAKEDSALFIAVKEQRVAVVDVLLDNGIDVHCFGAVSVRVHDHSNYNTAGSALCYAFIRSDEVMARKLLQHTAGVIPDIALRAAFDFPNHGTGVPERLNILSEAGIDPLNAPFSHGATVLAASIKARDMSMVDKVLDRLNESCMDSTTTWYKPGENCALKAALDVSTGYEDLKWMHGERDEVVDTRIIREASSFGRAAIDKIVASPTFVSGRWNFQRGLLKAVVKADRIDLMDPIASRLQEALTADEYQKELITSAKAVALSCSTDVVTRLIGLGVPARFFLRELLWATAPEYLPKAPKLDPMVGLLLNSTAEDETALRLVASAYLGLSMTLSLPRAVSDEVPELAQRWAMRRGHHAIVMGLVELYPPPQACTLVMEACYCNDMEILRLLSDRFGAEECSKSELALYYAVGHGNIDMITLVLDLGCAINAAIKSPTHHYISDQEDCDVQDLLRSGAYNSPFKHRSDTALLHAIDLRRIDVAQLLVKRGADVNLTGVWSTPLSHACARKYKDIVKMLLEAGAEIKGDELVEAVTSYITSITTVQSEEEYLAVVKMLCETCLRRGDSLAKRWSESLSMSLEKAIMMGNLQIANYLLEQGATVTRRVLVEAGGSRNILQWLHEWKVWQSQDDETIRGPKPEIPERRFIEAEMDEEGEETDEDEE